MQRLLFVSLFCVLTSANVKVTVKEDSDAVLPCSLSTKENIETSVFNWKKGGQEVFLYNGGQYHGNGLTGQDKQFESRVSHFNEELKNGNASIKITETKVADRGNYTCILPRLKPPQQFIIELVVDACREPSVQALKSTNDQAVLQCVVKGASPEPKVEWRDSSGNILPAVKTQVTERGGINNTILQTTVTKSDTYSCVVTQDAICHQISNDLHVHIHGSGFSAGSFITAVALSIGGTLLIVLLVLAVLFAKGCINCRTGNATPQNTRQADSPPETVNLNLKT